MASRVNAGQLLGLPLTNCQVVDPKSLPRRRNRHPDKEEVGESSPRCDNFRRLSSGFRPAIPVLYGKLLKDPAAARRPNFLSGPPLPLGLEQSSGPHDCRDLPASPLGEDLACA
jgi:hypothetical protein